MAHFTGLGQHSISRLWTLQMYFAVFLGVFLNKIQHNLQIATYCLCYAVCILIRVFLIIVALGFSLSLSPNHQTCLLLLHQPTLILQRSELHSHLQHGIETALAIPYLAFPNRFLDRVEQGLKMSFICLPSGCLWWLLTLCKGYSCQQHAALMYKGCH